MRMYLRNSVLLMLLIGLTSLSQAQTSGVELFSDRCVLCHGTQGMGEGPLPMSISDYPSTNLIYNVINQTRDDVFNAITHGSTPYMPPWKDELTQEQIASLTDFVMLLRSSPANALKELKKLEEQKEKNIADGKLVYNVRCVLCHGPEGLGDGRMSKVVKTPPPFNLTLSRMPKDYLRKIISDGGEAVWRSPQMPPWRDQLSQKEINAVIEYIITLRRN